MMVLGAPVSPGRRWTAVPICGRPSRLRLLAGTARRAGPVDPSADAVPDVRPLLTPAPLPPESRGTAREPVSLPSPLGRLPCARSADRGGGAGLDGASQLVVLPPLLAGLDTEPPELLPLSPPRGTAVPVLSPPPDRCAKAGVAPTANARATTAVTNLPRVMTVLLVGLVASPACQTRQGFAHHALLCNPATALPARPARIPQLMSIVPSRLHAGCLSKGTPVVMKSGRCSRRSAPPAHLRRSPGRFDTIAVHMFHATTVLAVRHRQETVMASDGQVSFGETVVKQSARKIRKLYNDRVLAGFAGSAADSFALFSRFESKLEQHRGNLERSVVELVKDWRTDRVLRRLEAMLLVMDVKATYLLSGTGDLIEPDDGIIAIGSGGAYAMAAAKALARHTPLDARRIAEEAMTIAAGICIYSNDRITIESLPAAHG
jgi:ATP-dependent HslUV protease, peptidase subunit HslV